jgi:hypothetical protein
MKIAGSGSEVGSGSISQRHGTADTDPHQNVMDPLNRPNTWSNGGHGRSEGLHDVSEEASGGLLGQGGPPLLYLGVRQLPCQTKNIFHTSVVDPDTVTVSIVNL